MKRHLAFAYDAYYPSGAKGDFYADFDSVEAAVEGNPQGDYLDILDTQTGDWAEFVSEGNHRGGRYRTWKRLA